MTRPYMMVQLLSIYQSMTSLREMYSQAWRNVISPVQYQHNINVICPTQQRINGSCVQRISFDVHNDEGKNISCLILKQFNVFPNDVVLYLHGNGGCKLEALGFLSTVVTHNIAVIAFDFVGCGNSAQGYLTYGRKEAQDAAIVLREAYNYMPVNRLTVWGRSMGALTAIQFAQKNSKIISNMVLDSPFRSLMGVIKRVIRRRLGVPQPVIGIICYFLRKQIESRLGFPLFDQDYLQNYKRIAKKIPTLFLYGEEDYLVTREDVLSFYNATRCEREIIQIKEDHEQERGQEIYTDAVNWIQKEKTSKHVKLKLHHQVQYFDVETDVVDTMC